MEIALVVGLVVVAFGLSFLTASRKEKLIDGTRGPRLRWFVVVPLLILIAALFSFRLAN